MSIQKVVEELTAKKKAEMESAGSTAPPVEPKASDFIDLKKFPKITNGVSYSDVAASKLPSGENPVYPAVPSTWKNKDAIPTPDKDWIADHKTLPHTIAAITYGHNLLMVGPTGAGKTTDVREVCARIGMPYARVNGVEGMEPADLYGQIQLSNGQTHWVDGPIMDIVRNGGVLAVDEPFKMPPGTLMGMQWLAETAKSGRAVMLYGHPDPAEVKVDAHPEFRMVLCDNCRGTGDNMDIYAATNVQDASFINRMQYKIRKEYMEYDVEVDAVQRKYPWVLKPLAERMVRLAGVMRTAWSQGGVELPFSFRELETWAEIISENGGDIKEALFSSYGNMLEDGDEKQILGKAVMDVGL